MLKCVHLKIIRYDLCLRMSLWDYTFLFLWDYTQVTCYCLFCISWGFSVCCPLVVICIAPFASSHFLQVAFVSVLHPCRAQDLKLPTRCVTSADGHARPGRVGSLIHRNGILHSHDCVRCSLVLHKNLHATDALSRVTGSQFWVRIQLLPEAWNFFFWLLRFDCTLHIRLRCL